VLDLIGLIPGIGDVVDGVSAGIYATYDEIENAIIALIGVTAIPFVSGIVIKKVVKPLVNKILELVGKTLEELAERAAKEAAEKAAKALVPDELLKELAESGEKYTPDDVVMVTKTPEGKLMWLEKGSSSSGLEHIVGRHADEFTERGIDDIPEFLSEVLKEAPVKVGTNSAGPFAEYLVDGKMYRVAYGGNGYVVSFFPLSK
jgi:hypothetical protein